MLLTDGAVQMMETDKKQLKKREDPLAYNGKVLHIPIF